MDNIYVSNGNKTVQYSVNAKRLTLDGDIQYLFDWSDRGESYKEEFKTEELVTIKNEIKPTIESTEQIDVPMDDRHSIDSIKVKKEENVVKETKQEPNINSDSYLLVSSELPVNNTATSPPHSVVVLD